MEPLEKTVQKNNGDESHILVIGEWMEGGEVDMMSIAYYFSRLD